MRKANSSVLHVVVGAGIIPHFRNAIESVIANTDDLVLAVYNSISPADSDRFSQYAENAGFGDRVVFRTLGNQGTSKTGSLYDAYNMAIDFATEAGFDYLNLVQADCQLMWWSEALVARLDEIFARANGLNGSRVLCVGTDFPVFGKFVGSGFRSGLNFDPLLGAFVDVRVGMGDVAIYSMAVIRDVGFRFGGTEAELQERYLGKGYRVPLLDVPCVAFIPWPASVRNGKVVGAVVEPVVAGTALLRLVGGRETSAAALTWENENFWMEDWVAPNGWNCLFPYWPTSIDNPKWLRRRLDACRLRGVQPWATTRQRWDGPLSAGVRGGRVPTNRHIFWLLSVGYLRLVITFLRRLFRSVATRVRLSIG